MSRMVTTPTSDSDAAAKATALLTAADTLNVPLDRVKTVSAGARVGFSAPNAVYTEAALTGGVPAADEPDDPAGPGLPVITAHISVIMNGGAQQVYATVDPVPGDTQRVVSFLFSQTQPFDMMTGSTSVMVYATNSPFASSTVQLTDVETQSSVNSPISGAAGTTLTLTLQPVAP